MIIIALFVECISVINIMYALSKRAVKWQYDDVVLLFFWTYMLYMIEEGIFPSYTCIIIYLTVCLLHKLRLEISWSGALLKSVLTLIVLGFIEMLTMFLFYGLFYLFDIELKDWHVVFLIMSICVLICSIGFLRILISDNLKVKSIKEYFDFGEMINESTAFSQIVLIITIVLIMGTIKFDFVNKYMQGLLFIFVVFLLLYRTKELIKLERIKAEYEMKNISNTYDEAYEELIMAVRRNQHDYKNQLEAIKGMWLIETENTNFEEKEKYLDGLKEKFKYDSILTGCNNSTIAGYLYSKALEFDKCGINFKIKISVDQGRCKAKIYELLEILGVLLNNAYECVKEYNQKNPTIDLRLQENGEGIYIEVKNVSERKSYSEIEQMFKEGFSTKGKARGIGLYSVKLILKKYNVDMLVENTIENKINWLDFSFTIPV